MSGIPYPSNYPLVTLTWPVCNGSLPAGDDPLSSDDLLTRNESQSFQLLRFYRDLIFDTLNQRIVLHTELSDIDHT